MLELKLQEMSWIKQIIRNVYKEIPSVDQIRGCIIVFDGKAQKEIYAKVKIIVSTLLVKMVLDSQLNIVKILLKKNQLRQDSNAFKKLLY